MTKEQVSNNDLRTQDVELGEQSVGKFIKETQQGLTFWDGFKYRAIASRRHLDQLERGLEIYLDKQMEHVEYTLALTMSKRRGELFEVYQKAITEISTRVRDHTIAYRDKTKERVLSALKKFMEDADSFDAEIAASGISSRRAQMLLDANENLTNKNYESIIRELTTELDHYTEMCERIYVGMTEEIEEHRMKDVTPR